MSRFSGISSAIASLLSRARGRGPREKEPTVHFELTEQQRMIRDAAADFAAKQIAPIAAELDRE